MEGGLNGRISDPAADKLLNLRVSVLSSGSVRIRVTEDATRWQVGVDTTLMFLNCAIIMFLPNLTVLSCTSLQQPQDILIPEGLAPAPFSILQHDDAKLPPLLRAGVQQKLVLAVSFSSSTDPTVAADSLLAIYSAPLKFELYQAGVLQIAVNERAMMHYEQLQEASGKVKAAAVGQSDAERHGGKEVVDYGEDGELHPVLPDLTSPNFISLFSL